MPLSVSASNSLSKFQSAPGREAGRCLVIDGGIDVGTTFQSAPGREAGRCLRYDARQCRSCQFQSAPGREAGRCGGERVRALQILNVSIRARP